MRKFTSLCALLVLFGSGCVNKEKWPYLGKWNGGFRADTLAGAAPSDLKRWDMPGYLMIYATKWTFKLHLEAEQAIIDVKGTWKVRNNAMTLNIVEVKIDDKGGEERRNPNLKYLSAETIRKTLGRELSFKISRDGKEIDTALLSYGDLLGIHHFKKANKAEG